MGLGFALGVTLVFVILAPIIYMQMRGHPKGLQVLFVAEMWERFSYYGMRALLIFYLTWHFLVDRSLAYQTYAAYVALVYLAPLLGGYLADRYIGFRKAVTYGALLLVAGHSLMSLHGQPASEALIVNGQTHEISRKSGFDQSKARTIHIDGQGFTVKRIVDPTPKAKAEELSLGQRFINAFKPSKSLLTTKRIVSYEGANGELISLEGEMDRRASQKHKNILFLAMSLIIAGVGFLKPNISTCVGALYEQGDSRRDSGFTLYYLGINVGAALASLWCAYLAAQFGWAWGFGAAAIGMILGLVVFLWGQKWLDGKAEPRDPELLKQSFVGPINKEWGVYLAGLGLVALSYFAFQSVGYVRPAMHVVAIFVLTGVMIYMLTKLDKVERERMLGLIILVLTSVLFWTLFDQGPSTLNIFAADYVDDKIGPLTISAPQLQSLNPLFIVVFGMVVAAIWTRLAAKGKEPSPFFKFGIAMIQIGLGFWVLNYGIKSMGVDADGNMGKVAIIWVALMYFLHTTGELCLSPVGLSSVTKLSPVKIVGFMMGTWFLASSYANVLAGIIAEMTVVPEGTSPVEEMAVYSDVFNKLGIAAIGLGVVLILANPMLKKLLHGR